MHARGRRDDEPDGVRPPQGSANCTLCRAAVEERDTALDGGTGTVVIDSRTQGDAAFLAGVSSPFARRMLLERRQRESFDQERIENALDEMDAIRPLVIDVDKAQTHTDRRKATRKLLRATRGPRW